MTVLLKPSLTIYTIFFNIRIFYIFPPERINTFPPDYQKVQHEVVRCCVTSCVRA